MSGESTDNAEYSKTSSTYRYWAFISYSHHDSRWGQWLHSAIERYRVPSHIVGKNTTFGPVPRRLFPVFRDRDELASSADLAASVREALAESRCLIVICSRYGAASRWVDEEVRVFKALHGDKRIVSLIIDGEPNAHDRPGGSSFECFPKAVRLRLGQDQEPIESRVEPVGGDVRPGRDGRKRALIKIVAAIIGGRFDELWQREQRRAAGQRFAIGLGVFATCAVVAGMLISQEIRKTNEKLELTERDAVLSDFVSANKLLSLGQARDGLVYLARSLSRSLQAGKPFAPAAQRLFSTLVYRNFALPIGAPIQHSAGVYSIDFSPDGHRLVTGSWEGTARVWSVPSGAPVGMPLKHHDKVNWVKFSPDGALVLTASTDKTARVWNAETGVPISPPLVHLAAVESAFFDATGRSVLTSSG